MKKSSDKQASAASAKKAGGGVAAGGGINFQAAVTAIAGARLLHGTQLDWIQVPDVPVAVWAESEGVGDDMRLELSSGASIEIQAKKGLRRGLKLWEPLVAMIKAVMEDRLEYGVLLVAPDSSKTVQQDLVRDIDRLGQGRVDHLTNIGSELYSSLQQIGGKWRQACQKVNIRVVHALRTDDADIRLAKALLRSVCADEGQANAAWNVLYRDAVALIEQRGRWTMAHLLMLFKKEGIAIRDGSFPAAIAAKLSKWVQSTNNSFNLPLVRKRLPLDALLKMRTVEAQIGQPGGEDVASALASYHDSKGSADRDVTIFDAEWTGWFTRLAVVVAGPGMGKSTLITLLASNYAKHGFQVLAVKLKPIAAAMERGSSFVNALLCQALDGSGITPESFEKAKLNSLVILADGLDDCGGSHDSIANALNDFSLGHKFARIVVTTRPIGYTTTALVDWKHYRLLTPDKNRGEKNLAKLLAALKESGKNSVDALSIANRELAASSFAEDISRSPHLLGMAAALISFRGELPDTRLRLYSELVGLIETGKEGVGSHPSSMQVAEHILDGLGWVLMQDSLTSAAISTRRCAELLANSMESTLLAMLELVEPVLSYWEQLGIIEQLHHDGTAYWTFVHKTFAEFSAARYLTSLSLEERADYLNRFLDKPEWNEVIAFAGGLGLGDEITCLLIERKATGHSGQMEQSLALVGDRDAKVSENLIRQIVQFAFDSVKAGGKDRFDIGLALAELVKTHPSIVGRIAKNYLQDEQSAARLTAWACMVSIKSNNYEADELVEVLRSLLPSVSIGMTVSLLGGLILTGEKDRDLIERIALAALFAQPDAGLNDFVETQLAHGAFGSTTFCYKVEAFLMSRGVADKIELPWGRYFLSSMSALKGPPEKWCRASSRALLALAEAVVDEGKGKRCDSRELLQFPQFGALVSLTGFNKVPAYDVYEWEESYDVETVRVVLQALVQSSAIDLQALGAEASTIIFRADADHTLRLFDLNLPEIDVPDPDWCKAALLVNNWDTLVTAMNHGSVWMAYVAANMLEAISSTKEQSRSLLEGAVGTSLWAATEVVRVHQSNEIANELILDRLEESLPEGAQYMFEGIQKGKVDISPKLYKVIKSAFASSSVTIADAAAKLIQSLDDRGQKIDSKLVGEAYDDWLIREPQEKESGVIPPSPRETLLKVLISRNALGEKRLIATLSDIRSDVRSVGKEHLLNVIATSESLKETVINLIQLRKFPAAEAASVIRQEIPMTDAQKTELVSLMTDQEPKWRRVGVELLRPCYFSLNQINQYAERLLIDENDEIRRVAGRFLLAAKSGEEH